MKCKGGQHRFLVDDNDDKCNDNLYCHHRYQNSIIPGAGLVG